MCPHPCGPPHDQCHRHKSSGSSSSSSSSSSGSSSGGGSSSSSSGGSSSSSGGGGGSSSNNWHNDGYDNNSSGNDNSVDYNSENYENWSTDGGDWSHDGWDSSNLDTGSSSGVSGLNVAQSVVPFIFGAAMVGLIAAALVVMRVSRFMFLFAWKLPQCYHVHLHSHNIKPINYCHYYIFRSGVKQRTMHIHSKGY